MKKSLLNLFGFISVLLTGCGSEQPFGDSLPDSGVENPGEEY